MLVKYGVTDYKARRANEMASEWSYKNQNSSYRGLSAGTGKLCIFGHLGLVFIWSCFVSCLLLLLYYVICAPVLTEGTENWGEIQANA